jgi:hypothetical protein
MWWLYYLVGIAVLVAAWWLIRAWLRRPAAARPVDEDELRSRASSAEARQRREQYKSGGDHRGPGAWSGHG